MKRIVYAIIIVSLMGCISSEKYLDRGDYNKALEKSIKKLQRRKDKPDEIKVLKKAYPKANEKDLERIEYLNMEGRPDRWDEILRIYKRMQRREALLETVLPLKLNGETVDFKDVDYKKKIVEAKKNAAAYHYKQGNELLRKRDKSAYRKAYHEFEKAKSYFPNYKDVKEQMEAAREMGTTLTLITAKNSTRNNFSGQFYDKLLSLGTARINSDWQEFIIKQKRDNFDYDYIIYANITNVKVGPEETTREKYTKKKKIQDGWEYILDEDGNVKKDSSGNDMKRPDFKQISCKVTENTQKKYVKLEGNFEIVNNMKNQRLVNDDVSGIARFRHTYIIANGDLRALPDKLKKKVGGSPVSYPDDEELLLKAAEDFSKNFRSKIYLNKKYLD